MFTKTNIITTLNNATNKALDIFNKTMTELSRINTLAQEKIDSNHEEIGKLNLENEDLNSLLTKNDNTIKRIKGIIE